MHFYCPHLLFFLPPLHHCLRLCLDHLSSILIPHLPYCARCVLPFLVHCSFLTLAFSRFNLRVRRTTSFQPVHLSLSSLPPPPKLCPSACGNWSSKCCKVTQSLQFNTLSYFYATFSGRWKLLLCADFLPCTLILADEDLDYVSFLLLHQRCCRQL